MYHKNPWFPWQVKEHDGLVAELQGALAKLREDASQERSRMQAQLAALQEVRQLLSLLAPTTPFLGRPSEGILALTAKCVRELPPMI